MVRSGVKAGALKRPAPNKGKRDPDDDCDASDQQESPLLRQPAISSHFANAAWSRVFKSNV
jgi:hypothetical protein